MGDVCVTEWAIFPIFAAAFSKNEAVGVDGVCARGCRVVRCGLVAPPSGCRDLLVF